MSTKNRPGGELAARPLHFIWIVDCSGSMGLDNKIESLNSAIREAIPHMQEVAEDNPNAEILMRVVTFSSGAQWHVATPTPVDQFKWEDVVLGSVTDMGAALRLVAEQLKIPPMSTRALPPVLVLVTDGMATDDFAGGLHELLSLPWGKKAVKIAIAIGDDPSEETLEKFMGMHGELKPLRAHNAEQLVNYIKWASSAVVQAASSPLSQVDKSKGILTPLPPPADSQLMDVNHVW